jgi:hypothetical protein
MSNLNAIQGNSVLFQLLAIQTSAQPSKIKPLQIAAAQSDGADSLSISSAALKALQGLGVDLAETQRTHAYATYNPHGHHHHLGAQAPQETATQPIQAPSAESVLLAKA